MFFFQPANRHSQTYWSVELTLCKFNFGSSFFSLRTATLPGQVLTEVPLTSSPALLHAYICTATHLLYGWPASSSVLVVNIQQLQTLHTIVTDTITKSFRSHDFTN